MLKLLARLRKSELASPASWQSDEELLADPRNALLVESGLKRVESERKKIRDEIASAISNHKHFLTLGWGVDHDWFVAEVTDAANDEPRVLSLQFHSFFKNSATGGSGKATLTLAVEAT